MGQKGKSRLKTIVEKKIPAVVCSQFEDRFVGYNVVAKDYFIAFPRKYTGLIGHPLKTRAINLKNIMIIPFGEEDEIFFNNNLDKFKKAYEAGGEKVFETIYGSLKELQSSKGTIR
tara:strand:+ start:1155 stop:1502 length:348 start_codon:yes stop_codon:yes gene_type:complete